MVSEKASRALPLLSVGTVMISSSELALGAQLPSFTTGTLSLSSSLPLASYSPNVTKLLLADTATDAPMSIAVLGVSPYAYFSAKPEGRAASSYRLSSLLVAYTLHDTVLTLIFPSLSTEMLSTDGTTSYTTVSALFTMVSSLVYS